MLSVPVRLPVVGKTTQHLHARIEQHVRSSTLMALEAGKTASNKQSSAICEHLILSPECAAEFNTDQFRVIGHVRNWTVLDMLEVVYITTLQPELCKHMQFVKMLHCSMSC